MLLVMAEHKGSTRLIQKPVTEDDSEPAATKSHPRPLTLSYIRYIPNEFFRKIPFLILRIHFLCCLNNHTSIILPVREGSCLFIK